MTDSYLHFLNAGKGGMKIIHNARIKTVCISESCMLELPVLEYPHRVEQATKRRLRRAPLACACAQSSHELRHLRQARPARVQKACNSWYEQQAGEGAAWVLGFEPGLPAVRITAETECGHLQPSIKARA